jgi:predicted Zn finger-like uncharacterized protein
LRQANAGPIFAPIFTPLRALMLIDCPGCGKSYHIIKAVLAPYGRRVACPRCDSIWFVSQDGQCIPDVPNDFIEADVEADVVDDLDLASPGDIARTSLPPALPPWGGPSWVRVSLALVVISMALIGFRREIVQLWPRTATGYAAIGMTVNLRGLALENFRTVAISEGARTVLGIEGDITNLRAETTKIPLIRLAVRDAQGRTLYSWDVKARQPKLEGNQSLEFRTRLAAPPTDGADVLVDFVPAAEKPFATAWRQAWRF